MIWICVSGCCPIFLLCVSTNFYQVFPARLPIELNKQKRDDDDDNDTMDDSNEEVDSDTKSK